MGGIYEALRRAERERPGGKQPSAPGFERPDDAALNSPLRAALEKQAASRPPPTQAPHMPAVEYHPGATLRGLFRDPRLVVAQDRTGPQAQEYRQIRDRLLKDKPLGQSQLWLFSSGRSGEGKTLTLANLALTLTELPTLRTLVVDGDLGSGKLSSLLEVPPGPGLIQALLDRMEPAALLQATAWKNLLILPAGGFEARHLGQSLLMTPLLVPTLRKLRSLVDLVLVDGPAIARGPGAGLLARGSDGVVLVVGAGRPARIQRTARYFQALQIPLRGCILAGGEAE